MTKDTKLIVVAVVLILVAVLIFARNMSSTQSAVKAPPTKAEIEKQIAEIQNNEHMPAQAKAIAIGQLRAHTGGGGGPVPSAPSQ